jgi:hypothetical protein
MWIRAPVSAAAHVARKGISQGIERAGHREGVLTVVRHNRNVRRDYGRHDSWNGLTAQGSSAKAEIEPRDHSKSFPVDFDGTPIS